jgi:hypothetical protein
MPQWFKPSMVVLAGMVLLLLAGAPRGVGHSSWITSLADPTTLRLFGAVMMGIGVYWGLIVYHSRRRKRTR